MQELIKNTEEKMNKTVAVLERDYKSIRAGRANPQILDKVTADYYGSPTPINQLAAVSVTEARTLTIQPWDASVLRMIEKAIQMSEIGINPQNDGKCIRLIFPPLTEDKRKEIAKEIVRCGGLEGSVKIALDYFDASINRISAWTVGFRSWQKALLSALCTPNAMLLSSV